MTRMSRPKMPKNKGGFAVTAVSCKWRYDVTCMPVARIDEACKTMMVTWNGERLVVAWRFGPKAGSGAQ